jgi:TolB-like protein/predicted Zn-dependent protease
MSLYQELKRRNVIRVAIAYLAASWLLIEAAETIFPLYGFGDTPARILVTLLAIGFPLFLVFSWVFEFTPEGLKLERDIEREESIAPRTGKKLDRTIIVLLALALGYFAFDRFVLDPARDAALVEETAQQARSEALVESYGEKSIAVLPFVNMSADPEQEYFSDGVSEELLNLLAKIPELRVISRSSAFSFKGKGIAIPEVGKRLNVAHILEGSVRRAGGRVRITAQLIEARSDTHLWSETYDRTLDDIFAVQDEIAAAIGDALKVKLALVAGEAVQPTAIKAANSAAYDAYLRGRDLINQRGRENTAAAIPHLERALRLDANFAPAHAQLAIAMILYPGFTPVERHTAIEHLDRAQALEPDLAETHAGRVLLALKDEDFESAVAHARKALAVNPNYIDAMRWLADALEGLGRNEEAETLREQVLVIDPLSVVGRASHAMGLADQGRTEEAHAIADQLLAEKKLWAGYRVHVNTYLGREGKLAEGLYWALKGPGHEWYVMFVFLMIGEFDEARRTIDAYSYLIDAHEGRWDEAIQAVLTNLELYPDDKIMIGDAADALYLAGRFDEALPIYERLLDMALEGQRIPGWNPLGQTMALALARRKAGDEPGAQEAASIVRQRLGERRAAGVKTWFLDLAEALLAAFEHDRDPAVQALKSAIQNGLRTHVLFSDPMFEDLRDDPGYVALRQELEAILAEEREKVLQLICFHNPVPDEWQPLPETCEGEEKQL